MPKKVKAPQGSTTKISAAQFVATAGRIPRPHAFSDHPEALEFMRDLVKLRREGQRLPSARRIAEHMRATYKMALATASVVNWLARLEAENE